MEKDRLAALKLMLDGFAQKQQKQDRDREDRRAALEKFLNWYGEITQSIIRPAFEDFSQALAQSGHPCTVDVDKPVDPGDSASAAKLTLTIYPAAVTLAQGNPSLSYKASPNQRKITVSRSIITMSGGIVASVVGEYLPEQLSREMVEQQLFDLANATFAPQ
jgi:hypothetical protein